MKILDGFDALVPYQMVPKGSERPMSVVIPFPVNQFGAVRFGHQWNPVRLWICSRCLARASHW
ncbi:MAG: hypothetical protein ACREDD_14240, partial [Methylocella sp.]